MHFKSHKSTWSFDGELLLENTFFELLTFSWDSVYEIEYMAAKELLKNSKIFPVSDDGKTINQKTQKLAWCTLLPSISG